MGYPAPIQLVDLDFGEDRPGLEVRMRKASHSALALASRLMDLGTEPEVTERDTEIILQTVELFSKSLYSWNLEDPTTGELLPADEFGIAMLSDDFLLELIAKWLISAELDNIRAPVPDGDIVSTLGVVPLDG